jgi:hypothetical protein
MRLPQITIIGMLKTATAVTVLIAALWVGLLLPQNRIGIIELLGVILGGGMLLGWAIVAPPPDSD